jgi:hypothetical protein
MRRILIFSSLFLISAKCQDTFSNYDLAKILLSGRQSDRIAELDYKRVCQCQCQNLVVYNQETKR